jgi:hypothetical protein
LPKEKDWKSESESRKPKSCRQTLTRQLAYMSLCEQMRGEEEKEIKPGLIFEEYALLQSFNQM